MSSLVPEQFYIDDETERVRHAVCEYLESISEELAKMAYSNGFDSLTVLFEMARQDAKRIRLSSDKHVDRP